MSDLEPDLDMSPQPLSRVRPSASVIVTPEAVSLRPKLSPLIAEIIARWASLEVGIGSVLSHILGTEAAPVAAMIHAVTSASAQMDMIEAAGWAKLFDPDLELFEALIKIARAAAKKRNTIAHHVWAYCPELPDALLLVEPEAQSNVSVRVQQVLHPAPHAGTQSIWLNLSPDIEGVMVYRENDFRQIIEELNTVAKCASLLVLCLERVSAHDQIRRLLSSEPLIDAALKSIRKNRPPRPRLQQPIQQTENDPA